MNTGSTDVITPSTVLATKGLQLRPSLTTPTSHPQKTESRSSIDDGKCSNCGNSKHKQENCFMLHGCPGWWHDLQAKKQRDGGSSNDGPGRAAIATTSPHLSFTPHVPQDSESGNHGFNYSTVFDSESRDAWLLDTGDTDHMTFEAADFSNPSLPCRSSIANANGTLWIFHLPGLY